MYSPTDAGRPMKLGITADIWMYLDVGMHVDIGVHLNFGMHFNIRCILIFFSVYISLR